MNKQQFCDKLAHYAAREPKKFLQIDGFYLPEGGDDFLHPDKDGDYMHGTETVELMRGTDVRVLIPYETNAKVAARQLKKMAKWLKRRPDLMEFAKPDPEPKPKPKPEENICPF
jgi:hypothetical protein